jgi:quinone-modifying oxidoreductase subunit QmoC
MLYAGWGASERLIADPDVWLCHQCGDCTESCPRGVNPSDVLAGVRQLTYRKYATPAFLGKLLSKPALLPLAILIPVIIIAGIIYMAGTLTIPDGPVNYSKFFPHAWLNGSFTLITVLSYGVALFGISRFWKDLKSRFPGDTQPAGFMQSFWKVKNDILAHRRFNKCETSRSRKVAHFLVFYGFMLLLLVTLYAIYAAISERYPLSFWNPFKILGNIASLMLFTGLGIMIVNRIRRRTGYGNSTYSDWLLLVSMVLLTLSGTVIEAARFLNWTSAYHLYFFHLVCVWFVIIYLPFTKFGHLVYRTVAMTYAFSINRK